ncbi:class A sortase [Enterococcus pingfangensis]|uniref:class A sortase n=1 Tax=Enterococcus pingfangensis TaxID=2559924 RepID=UPI0010F8C22F|nr:class A sortase [Enterococcus pingfangensis]
MIKRIFKYFLIPTLLFFATTLWVYDGYHKLLTPPDTSVTLTEGQAQAAKNKAKAVSQTDKEREKIQDADMQVLVTARLKRAETMAQAGVGRLAIPSVDLDLPVLNQVTELNLSTGAAMYFPERPLGEGNVVLASHNFSDADVLLHRIKNVTTGTKIYLTDFTTVWIYRVTVNRTIHENQTEVLDQPKDGPAQVTLLRCEGGIGTPYRRVVQGALQKTQLFSTLTAKEQRALGINEKNAQATKSERKQQSENWMSNQLALSIQQKRPTIWLVGVLLVNLLVLAIQGMSFVRKD